MSRESPDASPVRKALAAVSRFESRAIEVGRALLDRHPRLTGPFAVLWATYIRAYVGLSLRLRSLRHTPAVGVDPFETVRIDPATVEFMTLNRSLPGPKYKRVGAVLDGDWDRRIVRFTATDLYRAFEAHFDRGVDWEETAFFDRVVGEIADGHERWECSTREEFEARCERLDRLYEHIDEHGYLTQAELASTDVEDPIPNERLSRVDQFIYDEMTVNVGRDGELLLGDGRDRFAIARLLDLDAVAVQVLIRHERWQRLLDRVASGNVGCDELPDHLRDHPDLRAYCGAEA